MSKTNKEKEEHAYALSKVVFVIEFLTDLWCKSENTRIFTLVIIIYFLGYFQCNYYIVALVGYALVYSHWQQIENHKSMLKAKYMHYDKDPELIYHLIGEIPKWVQFGDWEKCRFLNNAIEIFWPSINGAIENTLRQTVDPILQDVKPVFLSHLQFGKIDFGEVPLKIKSVKILNKEEVEDEVFWDMEIDLSGGGATIGITAGNKVISLGAVLKDIELKGTLRIVFARLFNDWPLFNCIRVSFMEKPSLDYNLSAVKIPLSSIPGFDTWLNTMIRDSLEFMIWPNELKVDLDAVNDDSNNTGAGSGGNNGNIASAQPKGVLRVRLIEAKNLQNKDLFGKSDPLALVWVGGKSPKLKTRIQKSTLHPIWDEVFEFTIFDKTTENLCVTVENYNVVGKNDNLGELVVDLQTLKDRITYTQWYRLKKVKSGSIHIELEYSPFIKKNIHDNKSQKIEQDTFKSRARAESVAKVEDAHSIGFVTPHKPELPQTQSAKIDGVDMIPEVKIRRSLSHGKSSGSVGIDDEESQTMTERSDLRKMPKVMDVPDFNSTPKPKNPKMKKIVNSAKKPIQETTKMVGKTVGATMKLIPGIKSRTGSPMVDKTFDALLNIKIINGNNLMARNRDGTSDPYVLLKIGERKFRSKTIKKTRNPWWNETYSVRVQSDEINTGIMEFTIKDQDKWTKDGLIGTLEIPIIDIMKANDRINKAYKLENASSGTINLELELLSVYSHTEMDSKT